MAVRRMLVFVWTGLLAITIPFPGPAEAGTRRVILLVADRLAAADLEGQGLPNLAELLHRGARGLMSGQATDRSSASLYATLGAGARVEFGEETEPAVRQVGESYSGAEVALVYQRRSGRPPGDSAVVIPGWPQLEAVTARTSPGARLGTLGTALRAAEMRTALVGNADRPGEPGRLAALLAVDGRGMIDGGQVDARLIEADPLAPFGAATDLPALLAATRHALAQASFVVVDIGDTLRADAYAGYCTPEQAASLRRKALRRLDAFLGGLLAAIDGERDLLILLAPEAPAGRPGEPRSGMAPVILLGPGYSPGLLSSPATRWPGLVAPTDIAPTVLQFLGLKPPRQFIGRPLTSVPGNGDLAALDRRIAGNEARRRPLLHGYALAQLAVILAVSASVWLALPAARLLQPLLLMLTLAPLGFLMLGAAPELGVAPSALLLTGTTLTASLLLQGRIPGTPALMAITLATAGTLAADQLLGYHLIRFSPLGYSPVLAFRFYGLGNEFMGVWVGACLVALSGFIDAGRRRGWGRAAMASAALGLGLATLLLAAPGIGANLGGAVTAAVASAWTMASVAGRFRPPIRGAAVILAGLLVVGLALGFDTLSHSAEAQAHFGRFGQAAMDGGLGDILPMLERKLDINLRLIRHTIWSRLFLGLLAGVMVLRYRPPGVVKRILAANPCLAEGLGGILLGALVALAANDSGVVAAATTALYATATLSYLVVGEGDRRRDGPAASFRDQHIT
ncbi:MAG TPA: hypothetical protein DEQ28_02155 [Clostridiales bacterium]|nr:hypothetical protein [Clostridiales bacterium]